MCIVASPILAKPQDADQPTSRCRTTVERESRLSRIEYRSPPQRSYSTDSTPRMPQRTSTAQEGIRETTKTVPSRSYSSDSTPRMPHRSSTKRVHSHRHHHLNQDDSQERTPAPPTRLLSRWSSSARLIVDDGPPSQPLSCCQMSRGQSSVSIEESHHEDALNRSSSYPATIDSAPSEPLARHRMIAGSSRALAVKESLKHPFESLYLSAVPRATPTQRQMVAHFA
jgi:hypothetical protein